MPCVDYINKSLKKIASTSLHANIDPAADTLAVSKGNDNYLGAICLFWGCFYVTDNGLLNDWVFVVFPQYFTSLALHLYRSSLLS